MQIENRIYLASTSPQRRQLLAQIGVAFESVALRVDETQRSNEPPATYVERIAANKALAVAERGLYRCRRPVLAADTAIVLDGEVFGKPADQRAALWMLERLSGRAHDVLTSVVLVKGEHKLRALSKSRVEFRSLSATERRAYWASGAPAGKAGAYAIQGLGAVFIKHIEGSYSGVMGLPLFETAMLLERFDIRVLEAFAPSSGRGPVVRQTGASK